MKWRPFACGADTFDLCHLHPKSITYVQDAKGKNPARTYAVEVRYSMHCFTRSIKAGEKVDPALCYGDHREVRAFDVPRWELSHYLPGIVEGLAQRRCFHTGRGNFFTVELIDKGGNRVEYEVFFNAYRHPGKPNLLLFIQSAYVRDWAHSNRPHMKSIGFPVILYNVLNGKEIRTTK
jgi:hypothetical protein